MTELLGRLSRRWKNLWLDTPACPADITLVWNQLRNAYMDGSRVYHDLRHIANCLGYFDAAAHLANSTRRIEPAIWFHDAIYDTHAKAGENETRSAEYARKMLTVLGAGDRVIDDVVGLIMATTHSGNLTNPDEQLIADIDLAGLGQSWISFASDGMKIREEYFWVDEELFRKERARILEIFDSRNPLYYTSFFQQFEIRAHENLKRAIAELQA